MKFTVLAVTLLLGGCAGIPYDAALIRQPTEAELRRALEQGRLHPMGTQYRGRVNRDGTITIERY